MPTTPRGITYPTSSEHTRLWDHLEAVATSADAAIGDAVAGLPKKILTGTSSIPAGTANGSGGTAISVNVTFPPGSFTAAPIWVDVARNGFVSGSIMLTLTWTDNYTANGFRAVFYNFSPTTATWAAPIPFRYLAIGS